MRKGWEIKKLGEVCDVVGGGTPSKTKKEYFGGNVLWATVRDMNVDLINDTETKITELGLKNSSSRLIKSGNVIIATRVGLGKVCLLEKDSAINQDLKGIIPKKGLTISNKFIFWWCKNIANDIQKAGTGLTVQGVKLDFINSLKFPLLKLSEQNRIVSILDEAFSSIEQAKENLQRNLQNAKELFQSELNSIFERKSLNHDLSDSCDFNEGNDKKNHSNHINHKNHSSDNGEGWEEKTLNQISSNLDNKRVPITKNVRSSGEYPYYGASGIVDYVGDFIFDDDLLLVSEDGANLLARTYPIAFSISGKTWVNNHAHVLKFESLATQTFVQYYLNSIKLNPFGNYSGCFH